MHITLRVAADVHGLRERHTFRAIREATITTARREDFHVIHISIQGNHLHLLVEARNRTALARGMQGFEISARGAVFPDRYHVSV